MKKIILLTLLLFGFCSADQKNDNFVVLTDGLAVVNTKDSRVAIKVLMNELSSKTKEKKDIELKFENDVKNTIREFKDDKIAYLTLNFMNYLENMDMLNENVKDMYVFLPTKGNKSRYFLVTRNNDKINTIKDLKDKTIGLQTNEYTTLLYLNHTLLEKKLPTSKNFLKIKEYVSNSRVLMKLFFKKIDSCIVPEDTWNLMVELNPKISKKLKIIDKSKKIFIQTLSLVSKNMDDKLYKVHKNNAKSLTQETRGQEILSLLKSGDYKKIDKKFIDPMLEYYKEYLALQER